MMVIRDTVSYQQISFKRPILLKSILPLLVFSPPPPRIVLVALYLFSYTRLLNSVAYLVVNGDIVGYSEYLHEGGGASRSCTTGN